MTRKSVRPTWQLPDWPAFHFDATAVAPHLTEAYLLHGTVEGKAMAIGLGLASPIVLDAFSDEVMEGE